MGKPRMTAADFLNRKFAFPWIDPVDENQKTVAQMECTMDLKIGHN
jgi:hypothetical protein